LGERKPKGLIRIAKSNQTGKPNGLIRIAKINQTRKPKGLIRTAKINQTRKPKGLIRRAKINQTRKPKYLMKIITETRRAHYIRYLSIYQNDRCTRSNKTHLDLQYSPWI
jgi:hypothetical protein